MNTVLPGEDITSSWFRLGHDHFDAGSFISKDSTKVQDFDGSFDHLHSFDRCNIFFWLSESQSVPPRQFLMGLDDANQGFQLQELLAIFTKNFGTLHVCLMYTVLKFCCNLLQDGEKFSHSEVNKSYFMSSEDFFIVLKHFYGTGTTSGFGMICQLEFFLLGSCSTRLSLFLIIGACGQAPIRGGM